MGCPYSTQSLRDPENLELRCGIDHETIALPSPRCGNGHVCHVLATCSPPHHSPNRGNVIGAVGKNTCVTSGYRVPLQPLNLCYKGYIFNRARSVGNAIRPCRRLIFRINHIVLSSIHPVSMFPPYRSGHALPWSQKALRKVV